MREHCIRLAWIGIDTEKQGVGREPAEIDDTIDDRLRWIGLVVVGLGIIDEIGDLRNLFRRPKCKMDGFVNIIPDRLERPHTGLFEAGAPPPRYIEAPVLSRRDVK